MFDALKGALGGGGPSASDRVASAQPELLGTVRVAVVGEPSVGKTALTELIANGAPAKSCRSTAGCHIHVKLVELAPPGAAAPLGQQRFFVELWDVSGQPKYEALRSVFYKQLNGVILVYDLTARASLARLPKWAAEVAHEGSFVAPFGDELAGRNIGGLPVPVLVVGNKADRLRGGAGADAGSLSALVNSACSQILGTSGCSWWQRGISSLRGRRQPSEAQLAPGGELEPHVKGLTASAAAGQLDWQLLHTFFLSLWERRYKSATGVGDAFMHRVSSFAGHPGLPSSGLGLPGSALAAVTVATGGGAAKEDARLDDSWV